MAVSSKHRSKIKQKQKMTIQNIPEIFAEAGVAAS